MAARGRMAPLSGSSLVQSVRKRIREGGWPPGLTVLHGDDTYYLDEAQSAILDSLVPPDVTEFALTVYGEEKTSVPAVVGAARSLGMFSPLRVVLVKDVALLESGENDEAVLREYAERPPEGSYLVIRAPVLDKRRKLHKALAGLGNFLPFEKGSGDRYRNEIAAETRGLARERGIEPTPEVIDFLVESSGLDLYRIRSELDKLDAWLGGEGKRKAGIEEIREIATGTSVLDSWEVANAILARNLTGALSSMRRLLDSGENPIQLLGAIRWRASGMLQAKAMLESRRPRKEIIGAAKAWYYADALFAGLGRYTLEELTAFPACLYRADRALKSSSLEPGAVMENLLQEMIG